MVNNRLMKNRRGEDFHPASQTGYFALVIIIAAIIDFIIFSGIRDNRDNFSSEHICKNTFSGECKARCDIPEGEFPMKNGGCPGEGDANDAVYCCATPEKRGSSTIESAGATDEYKFNIDYIGPANMAELKDKYKCASKNSYDTLIECPAGKQIPVIIKVHVTNTGTQAMDIYANPQLSIDQEVKHIQGESQKIVAGGSATLTATFNIDPTLTASDINILAAAKCIDGGCSSTEGKGVYIKDKSKSMKITVISKK